jgi:hypothetical protein
MGTPKFARIWQGYLPIFYSLIENNMKMPIGWTYQILGPDIICVEYSNILKVLDLDTRYIALLFLHNDRYLYHLPLH